MANRKYLAQEMLEHVTCQHEKSVPGEKKPNPRQKERRARVADLNEPREGIL
ncbi:MAG TPA: hypothetical protein VE912_25790 [Bacteroidales bacterium]|nr:hypothetical protein [Bacteroidales bacterium]